MNEQCSPVHSVIMQVLHPSVTNRPPAGIQQKQKKAKTKELAAFSAGVPAPV